jgi:hypothetical protein
MYVCTSTHSSLYLLVPVSLPEMLVTSRDLLHWPFWKAGPYAMSSCMKKHHKYMCQSRALEILPSQLLLTVWSCRGRCTKTQPH